MIRNNRIVVVLVAIALGFAVYAFTRSPTVSPRGVPAARARLSACLTGEPPSKEGPDPTRLRAIQLAAAPDWPKRCEPFARALEQALTHDSPHEQGSHALAAGTLFEHYSLQSDVAALLTPAEDEPIVTDAASDVPPPPVAPVIAREVPAIAEHGLPPTAFGDKDLLLVSGGLACRLPGLEPVAHCSYPADRVPRMWLPLPTTTSDLDVWGDDAIRAFATGERLATTTRTSAWNVDGTLYLWPADASQTSVLRRAPSGATTTLRLPHKLTYATVVRDQLLWTEKDRVVGVDLGGATIGKVYEVAKGADLPRPTSCATRDIAATLLTVGGHAYRIAALVKGTWQLGEPGPEDQLQCSGETVTAFATEQQSGGLEIRRVDCSAAGCMRSRATLAHIAGPYAVAALGADTIVVWADDLVRAVSGPLATLAAAKPLPLYDGARYEQLEHKQTAQTDLVHDIRLIGRGNTAVVVIEGQALRLIHVRDGKPQRVSLVFE